MALKLSKLEMIPQEPFYGTAKLTSVLNILGEVIKEKAVRQLRQLLHICEFSSKLNANFQTVFQKIHVFVHRCCATNRIWCIRFKWSLGIFVKSVETDYTFTNSEV